MKIARHHFGFTLVELLTVIAIIGILAALIVPALKNVGNGNATVSATRQLLDDVGRARQLAISQHTTVYMVFVPTNFWVGLPVSTALTNLADKQLTGYTFMADGAIGDQPGQHVWHYLAPWQNLPDGTFIAQLKFNSPFNSPTPQPFYISQYNPSVPIYGFATNNIFPFPTEMNTSAAAAAAGYNLPYLPYIAFNYLGQLISEVDASGNFHDAYIPLAKGSVSPAIDPATRTFQFNSPSVSENLPGNSTNSYNIVHIDWLTGRARLEQPKVQ